MDKVKKYIEDAKKLADLKQEVRSGLYLGKLGTIGNKSATLQISDDYGNISIALQELGFSSPSISISIEDMQKIFDWLKELEVIK